MNPMIFKCIGKHPSERRISFLINFIDTFGLPRSEMMVNCGMSKGYLNNVFHSDNISISKIKKICKTLGYSCLIFLEPKNPVEAEQYREQCLRTQHTNPARAINLDFLLDLIEIEDMTKSDIGKRLNLSRSRVTYWLKTDNICLRRVYEICKAYNRNLHVIFKPLPGSFSDDQSDEGESKVIYDLHTHHCYTMQDDKTKKSQK